MSFNNIFIYVSDALRYDYIPDSVADEGNVISTLAPSGYTPISFSSLITGRDPRNHNVRSFYDTLEGETVFDRFENHSLYDHPDDIVCRKVFSNYTTSKEVEDLEEPFLYVERALDTHSPYGVIKHGNEIPSDFVNEGTLKERYQKGVESTEKHFWDHVEQLKELGLYEDTLIIFTSDHGELLGEYKLFRERTGHNHPICRELNVVPTVFLNYDTDWSHMRTIDILPTALSIAGKEPLSQSNGRDLTSEKPAEKGYTMMDIISEPTLATGCNWRYKDKWQPTFSKVKTDIATIFKDYFEPIKEKLKETKSVEMLRENKNEAEGPVAHIDV